MNFIIVSLQKPLSALNNPTFLFLSMANVSSKKLIQLLLLAVFPLDYSNWQLSLYRLQKQTGNDGYYAPRLVELYPLLQLPVPHNG